MRLRVWGSNGSLICHFTDVDLHPLSSFFPDFISRSCLYFEFSYSVIIFLQLNLPAVMTSNDLGNRQQS